MFHPEAAQYAPDKSFLEGSSESTFVVPAAYEGIEAFSEDPEKAKESIIEHYWKHIENLVIARNIAKAENVDAIENGLEPDEDKIDSIRERITFLETEIEAIEKINSSDATAMFPLQLKYQSVINSIYAFYETYGINNGFFTHKPGLAA